jgi:hypothetical protein
MVDYRSPRVTHQAPFELGLSRKPTADRGERPSGAAPPLTATIAERQRDASSSPLQESG